ncbi:hypothetical protein M6D81_11935 [Paenibacillus sp. J5C_2022]|uniref:hypothetical protein n=1 Tax=Paenibacillus sp. J5C2022 TaxID=2977129 RepID=UPI0021D28E21|nr:hypothetical protein [Paenibacillus sp. J5C2022]MCU6709415.1 hypothetical protein [Paenibacillus sp. J5C2022]
MATYLQLDGVDDAFKIPSLTFTRIVIDMTAEYIDAWGKVIGKPFGYIIQQNSNSGNFQFNADHVTAVNRDGVSQADMTPFVELGVRHEYEVLTLPTTLVTYIYNNNGSSGFSSGKIYDLKYYNGASLVAHYDMSTVTVQDQSGNGYHATLTGGTWLDDGEGGGVVHDVSAASSSISVASLAAVKVSVVQAQANVASTASASSIKSSMISAIAQSSSSAEASISSDSNITASASVVSSASAFITVVSKVFVASQSTTNAIAAVVKQVKVSVNAQSHSTATAGDGGRSFSVSAHAQSTTSASVSVVRRAFAGGAAAAVSSVWATVAKIARIVAKAQAQSVARVIESAPIRKKVYLQASRQLSVQLQASRQISVRLRGEM